MLKYRKIDAADDAAIAKIIRDNLKALKLDIPGTAFFDPELEHLSAFYGANPEKRIYFVAIDEDEKVVGGVGIAEFTGFDNCAELQKIYLDDSVKGKGYGKELLKLAEDWARNAGYKSLYLETHSNLVVAMNMYKSMGFNEIEKPDFVVHSTMDHFFLKQF